MFSGTPVYCSRDDVKNALDSQSTSYNDAQIDRIISASAASVEGQMSRRFYPEIDVRSWEWPNYQMGRSWRLWLDQNELLSFTQVVTGGIAITPDQFFLEPQSYGPPYSHLEFSLNSTFSYGGGSTPQRDITIYGTFGYTNATANAGTLTAAISTASQTTAAVSDSSLVGVGDMLLLGSEYVQVTAKNYTDSGQAVQGTVAAQQSVNMVTVTSGPAFNVGEQILVDAESMLIVGIAGNNLIVRRAWNGSTLAAHTGSEIYVPRLATIIRGLLGTTASTYLLGATVLRHSPPDLIRQLAIAESIYSLQQETGGYMSVVQRARDLGAVNSRIATSSMFHPIDELRENALTRYGRKVRLRAV